MLLQRHNPLNRIVILIEVFNFNGCQGFRISQLGKSGSIRNLHLLAAIVPDEDAKSTGVHFDQLFKVLTGDFDVGCIDAFIHRFNFQWMGVKFRLTDVDGFSI